MLTLIVGHAKVPNSHHPSSRLNSRRIPSLILEYNSKQRGRQYKKTVILGCYFGLTDVKWAPNFVNKNLDNSWCCGCAQGKGDIELEAEIMDFMAKSEKPTMFPTKDELVRAGRLDLVVAIKKRGGWYSLGWDEENVGHNDEEVTDVDVMEFQRRVESCKESASSGEHHSVTYSEDDDGDCVNSSSGNLDSLQLAASASMGRPQQTVADEESGIDGILSRLEKQRNSDFGINLGINGYKAQSRNKDKGEYMHSDTSIGFGETYHEGNSRATPGYHNKGTLDSSGGNIRHYTEPETWRTWSSHRAGSQHTEFEAAEISLGEDRVDADKDSYRDRIIVTTKEYAKDWDQQKEINYSEIRTRLQHLESELSTALHSLRFKREDSISDEVSGSPSDLQKLSDAVEFQENEFMSAKERLRSIRAKLAILEGKMALAITEAQKTEEVKQKHIHAAHKALQLLRTICIVWPKSASEVLLAGSFDGWTTQRRMEKSKSGIFSVSLRLYPGRYEIKFIVDGKWKVDPLRPIVNHGGYENNLLIVT